VNRSAGVVAGGALSGRSAVGVRWLVGLFARRAVGGLAAGGLAAGLLRSSRAARAGDGATAGRTDGEALAGVTLAGLGGGLAASGTLDTLGMPETFGVIRVFDLLAGREALAAWVAVALLAVGVLATAGDAGLRRAPGRAARVIFGSALGAEARTGQFGHRGPVASDGLLPDGAASADDRVDGAAGVPTGPGLDDESGEASGVRRARAVADARTMGLVGAVAEPLGPAPTDGIDAFGTGAVRNVGQLGKRSPAGGPDEPGVAASSVGRGVLVEPAAAAGLPVRRSGPVEPAGGLRAEVSALVGVAAGAAADPDAVGAVASAGARAAGT
jgi:hypothetical protein